MKKQTHSLGRDLENQKLAHLPLKAPVFVSEETSISQTLDKMRQAHIGCTLIYKAKQITGIFTERDFLTRVVEAGIDLSEPITKVMTGSPRSLPLESTLSDAIRLMDEGGYRNIPLIEKQGDHERVARVLTVNDVVSYIGANFPEEVYNLPPDPHQTSQTREGA